MNWSDERYVRAYTRDTTDWLNLSWQAQGLFLLLLRKVDRAGLLDLGKKGKPGLASHIGGGTAAWSELEAPLEELLKDGCVEVVGTSLLVGNFIEAQEAKQSDRVRQAESRSRRRDQLRSGPPRPVAKPDDRPPPVTVGHTASQAVTDSHTPSQTVTLSCAVPCRTEPTTDLEPPDGSSPPPKPFALEEAPPKPERKPSAQEAFWAWFQAERAKRFADALPDRRLDPRALNAQLKEPLRLAGELALRQGAIAYFGSPFARDECAPPGAFAPFIASYGRHVPRIGRPAPPRDPGGRNGANFDDQDPAVFEPPTLEAAPLLPPLPGPASFQPVGALQ